MKETPTSMSVQSGGQLDTKMDATGRMTPISTSYQAHIGLDDVPMEVRAGYRGKAKVWMQWKSIGWRIRRIVMKTFNFEF